MNRANLTTFLLVMLAGCAPRPLVQAVGGPAGTLHVDDGGTGGVPVVFLHSYAGNSAHGTPQLEHLRKNRRAVAIDLRGHGRSAAPAGRDYAVDSLAADVAAAVDALGLKRFVLVGHSLGGSTAAAYAGKHPDRVAGVVLAGTPGKSPPQMAQQVMQSMEADYDKVSRGYWEKLVAKARPEVRGRILKEINSVPKDDSLAIFRSVFAYDPLPALRGYPGPKLIISTGSDTPNDLQNQLPGVPHRKIEGTSHWMQMDKPEEFNRLLDEFLAALR